MNKSEKKRFDELYRQHLRPLKLQGMSDKTIGGYSRAVLSRLENKSIAGLALEKRNA